jgi:hypothetical protein
VINEIIIDPPAKNEIEYTIQSLRNKKTPGVDDIPTDLIKLVIFVVN